MGALAHSPKPHHVQLPPQPPKQVTPPPAPKQMPPPAPQQTAPLSSPQQGAPPSHANHHAPGHQSSHNGPGPQGNQSGPGPQGHNSNHNGPGHQGNHNGPGHQSNQSGPGQQANHNGQGNQGNHSGPGNQSNHSGSGHQPNHNGQGNQGNHSGGPGHQGNHSGPGQQASHSGAGHQGNHSGPGHQSNHNGPGHQGNHNGKPGEKKAQQASTAIQTQSAPSQSAPKQTPVAPQPKSTASASSAPVEVVAPIVTPSPAPPPPAASEARPPESASEAPAPRAEFEPPMRIGAAPPEKDTDGRPGRLSDDKASKKGGRDAATAVKSWASRMPPPQGSYSPQEVLAFNLTPAARERLRQLGYTAKPSLASGISQVIVPQGLDPWEAQRRLEAEFQQGFALNYLYDHILGHAHYVLDDTPVEGVVPVRGSVGCTTERCYGRKIIGWRDQLGACAKGVKIGVVDTGYDAAHPAFASLASKPKVVMEDQSNRAADWHGTGVLSLLAAAATSSTPGLVPEAQFLLADAFFKTSLGRTRTDTLHVLEALRRLEAHGAQIINMSLVGPSDELLRELIASMSARKGVVFVAAAGNGGPAAPPGYPAAYNEVIAVTAVDDRKRTYDYANRGRYIDVAAPGVRIWTALPDNKEGMLNGTSFAAPFVTAIAAATYNSTPLRAQLRDGRLPLDPKGAMLAAFTIEKLGTGERSDQYGLGLAKAPSSCAPTSAPALASVGKPPPEAATSPSQGDIKRAAYQ